MNIHDNHEHYNKGIIAWFVRNPVAANILMVLIIISGLYAVTKKIPLETFPSFERDVVNISVNYPFLMMQKDLRLNSKFVLGL